MKVHIETYGCQMNFSDTEIISSVLNSTGYTMTNSIDEADIILLNTCSVRDNAERKIHERIIHLKQYKKAHKNLIIGVLGCMAERLRHRLIEEKDIVSIVVGPDEYRRLPEIIELALSGDNGIAVKLSRVETYNDIEPLRTEGISAFISIMRGCNNFCSYCVVPYTRGRERSRDKKSIINEIINLRNNGFKEITLLGQNVNSYLDEDSKTDFPDLLKECAELAPDLRFRFTTSHPKDISDKLIETIAEYDNICSHIHLPVQSGSNNVLLSMDRGYTSEHYLERITKIKSTIGGVALTTDIIAGYPSESIEDHQQTLELMRKVSYDGAFMFKYSPREGTKSYKYDDNVAEEEKIRRLNEIIDLQSSLSRENNQAEIGNVHRVLVEGPSKRNPLEWKGRSDTNKVVIFPIIDYKVEIGITISVKINASSPATLRGEIVRI